MASQVEIVNTGLTVLGETRIASIDDNVKAARDAKALWAVVLDHALAANNWNFAKTRAQLSADATAPAFQYERQFQLPAACLRLVMANDFYVGADLTNYRGSPAEEYTIEGRKILTNWPAPLNIKYIQRIEDTTQFHPCFSLAFGLMMGMFLAEPLTQSDTKRARAEAAYNKAISEAVRSNAIELPPQKMADDEWILARR